MQGKVWARILGREGRDQKGKAGGRGWRWAGSGLEAGVALPLPRTLVSHTPRGSTPTAPDMLSPLWLPPSVVPYPQPPGPSHHQAREEGAMSPPATASRPDGKGGRKNAV